MVILLSFSFSFQHPLYISPMLNASLYPTEPEQTRFLFSPRDLGLLRLEGFLCSSSQLYPIPL